jgi:streptomycin 6-kinase
MNGQPPPGMLSIADWLRQRLQDDQLADLTPGTTVAPAYERRIALAVLDELSGNLVPGLCHGDASLRNIIYGGRGKSRLIDPRGMTGEAAYDVGVLAIRVARYAPAEDTALLVARAADLYPERVRAWMSVAEVARV